MLDYAFPSIYVKAKMRSGTRLLKEFYVTVSQISGFRYIILLYY